jgi:hypothetical protein
MMFWVRIAAYLTAALLGIAYAMDLSLLGSAALLAVASSPCVAIILWDAYRLRPRPRGAKLG